jgi:hypothetical protein
MNFLMASITEIDQIIHLLAAKALVGFVMQCKPHIWFMARSTLTR